MKPKLCSNNIPFQSYKHSHMYLFFSYYIIPTSQLIIWEREPNFMCHCFLKNLFWKVGHINLRLHPITGNDSFSLRLCCVEHRETWISYLALLVVKSIIIQSTDSWFAYFQICDSFKSQNHCLNDFFCIPSFVKLSVSACFQGKGYTVIITSVYTMFPCICTR